MVTSVLTSVPFIAVTLLVVLLNDASFIGGVRPFDAGDDGLVYEGFARDMLRQIIGGNIAGAFEGGEKVFYFTPGMRYLRAFEHVIFGETYLGYLSLVLLLPFLVLALFRRFLPADWSLATAGLHLLTGEVELELASDRPDAARAKARACILREAPVLCLRITGLAGNA